MPSIFFYKLTCDDGGAPCVQHGLLTLAICKPRIRMRAQKGDIVLGFAANSLYPDNRLIYVAELDEPIPNGEYFVQQRWKRRHDCIYEKMQGRFQLRKNARYHTAPGNLIHDLGEFPAYSKARVLVSRNYIYFGRSGTPAYKRSPLLRDAISRLGQGHRVHHSPQISIALARLAERSLRQRTTSQHGEPSQPANRHANHRGGGCGVVRTC